jgi:hypothetical protein
MGTNARRLDMLEKRARAAITEVAQRNATRLVAIWDGRQAKGRELWFHLRIGAAIAVRHPWLSFIRPGCQQIREIDLRRLDRRHPNTTIESLALPLTCRRCQPKSTVREVAGALQAAWGMIVLD